MSSTHLSRLLLVEGNDDRNVIRNLWLARLSQVQQQDWQDQYYNKRGWVVFCPDTMGEFEIKIAGDPGGVSQLLGYLPVYLQERPPVLERLGIVVDADDSPQSRWDEIASRLQLAGYQPPSHLPLEGLVFDHPTHDRPKIGIWLMPDNQGNGKLEDFVKLLIPSSDRLRVKAEKTLDEIKQAKLQRYSDLDYPKALIHTWLAWQEDPGRPMGQAITQKVLSVDSPTADVFVAWLQRLFCG